MIFPQMRLLDLSSNLLTGELPVEWGLNGAWAELLALNLQSNNLTGTIPDEWVEDDVSTLLMCLDPSPLKHNFAPKTWLTLIDKRYASVCNPCELFELKNRKRKPITEIPYGMVLD